jgi:Zn-dependent protease
VLLGADFGFGWQMLVWIAVVFASVLIHELGHAIVGKLFGGEPEIHLQMLGGVTYPRLRQRPTPLKQFVLSFAGPLFGLGLGALAWGLMRAVPPSPGSPSAFAMTYVIWCSLVWAVFNLLPVLPLDGGHMMLALIEGIRKKPSEVLASWISVVVAVATGVVVTWLRGFDPWLLLWFGFFAFQNFSRLMQARNVQRRAGSAPPSADALELAEIARSTEAARLAVARRDFDAALQAATELDTAGGSFRQAAALRLRAGIELARGDYETSALLAGQSFSIVQHPDSAVVAARANLRSGQQERAVNWLRRAVEAGAQPSAIQADPELSPLAGTP